MLRRFLTLLAVISGFAMMAQPAQAQEGDLVSIVEKADKDADNACSALHQSRLTAIMRTPHAVSAIRRLCTTNVLCVYLRADRARE